MRHEHGYTILSSILAGVIVLLCILFLLPKFMDTAATAQAIQVKSTAETFRSHIGMARFLYEALNTNKPVANVVNLGDGTVDLSAKGFPIGTTVEDHGILPQSAEQCLQIWQGLLHDLELDVDLTGDGDYKAEWLQQGKTGYCLYRYMRGGDMWIQYDARTGEVKADYEF